MVWCRWYRRFWGKEALSYEKELLPFLVNVRAITSFIGENIDYLLFSQSLIIGTPANWKRWLYPILSGLERLVSHLPLVPKLYFAAGWQKLPAD